MDIKGKGVCSAEIFPSFATVGIFFMGHFTSKGALVCLKIILMKSRIEGQKFVMHMSL